MMSGSTPPLAWLNPIAVLFLVWLYGAGVLVVRETAVRWKTGWPSILLLGAAYGIIEEGLAVKSFFDPAWKDLGTLGWYGRSLDVNWIWAVWLTIFHAVVSIAIPIFLVECIWPRIRGQPLTSRRGYITAIVLLAGAAVTINALLTPYRPSVWHLLGALAAVVFLVWAARHQAARLWALIPARKLPRSPRVYAIAGFGFLMGSFLLYGGGPFFGGFPLVTILEGMAVLVAVILLVHRTSADPIRWARQRFAFVAGCLGFLIVLDVFLELAGVRGAAVVAALFVYLLVRLYRRIPRQAPEPIASEAPIPGPPNPEPANLNSEWDSCSPAGLSSCTGSSRPRLERTAYVPQPLSLAHGLRHGFPIDLRVQLASLAGLLRRLKQVARV